MMTLHEFIFQDYYNPNLLFNYIQTVCTSKNLRLKGVPYKELTAFTRNETKEYISELVDLIEWCEREDVNPKMFVDAQLNILIPYYLKNEIPFNRGSLTSVKSAERYNQFREKFGAKERCFDSTILLPHDDAEHMYMLDFIYPKLTGGSPKSKDVKREIRQRGLVYRVEIEDYAHLLTRVKSFVDLLNLIDERLTQHIHICTRSFTWKDVLVFMRGYVL